MFLIAFAEKIINFVFLKLFNSYLQNAKNEMIE